jgi:AcrR family transcriptional regulator
MRQVPRLADHGQRHDEILGALLRIAGSRGLHAVSMRTVAAEAGMSVSTVQHYFPTKEQLLFAGLEHLAARTSRRATVPTTSAKDAVRAWLVQMIPADDEQRMTYTVFAAYHALALTDPALAAQPYARPSTALENAIRVRLQDAGVADDPAADTANLLALATGLGDGVMANMRTADEAIALLDHHLDRLFESNRSRPPVRDAPPTQAR